MTEGKNKKSLELLPITTKTPRSELLPGRIYLIDLQDAGGLIPPGKPSAAGGEASLRFIERALELIDAGLADGMVTAPISKESWKLAGVHYPGHTEFLQHASAVGRTEMLFMGGGFRAALYTTHCSLSASIAALKQAPLADFIKFVTAELGRYGLKDLRVAVAALNPHAGEAGMFGEEEQRIIIPAVEDCSAAGINITGPLPADTLFHYEGRNRFDLVIALYHDQGLIPIKTVAFYSAVNVTLGLPFIRTSPAHGAAFDIARKGVACPDGLVSAIETAAVLASKLQKDTAKNQ